MSKVWRFGITYHKDGDHVELMHVPLWVTVLEHVLDRRSILWLAGYVPGGYTLFSKLIFWLDDKSETVVKIPATPELLSQIAPDDEWLWGEEEGDGPEHAGNGAGG